MTVEKMNVAECYKQ